MALRYAHPSHVPRRSSDHPGERVSVGLSAKGRSYYTSFYSRLRYRGQTGDGPSRYLEPTAPRYLYARYMQREVFLYVTGIHWDFIMKVGFGYRSLMNKPSGCLAIVYTAARCRRGRKKGERKERKQGRYRRESCFPRGLILG